MLVDILECTQYYFSEKEHAGFLNGKRVPDPFIVYISKVIERHCLIACNWSKEKIYQRTEEMEQWLEDNIFVPEDESYKYDEMWASELRMRHKINEHFDRTDGRWNQFSVLYSNGFFAIRYDEDYRIACFHLGLTRPDDMPPEGYNEGVIKRSATPVLDMKFGRKGTEIKSDVVTETLKRHIPALKQESVNTEAPTNFNHVPCSETDGLASFDVKAEPINILATDSCVIAVTGLGKEMRVSLLKDEYVQLSQRNGVVIVGIGFDPEYRDGYLCYATADTKAEIANIKSRCYLAGDNNQCLTEL